MRQDFHKNLSKRDYKSDFYIHLRSSSSQSIEDASNNWVASTGGATDPRFRTNDVDNIFKIAELVLPQQDITQRGQDHYIEQLAFNPWRTLPENTAYGEIALARRISYEIAAKNRRDLNGQSVGEPALPRPSAFDDSAAGKPEHDVPWSDVSHVPLKPDDPTGDQIVRVAIHPGIGVARVGNSVRDSSPWDGGKDSNDGLVDDYYIGPETDAPPPMTPGLIRDNNGMLRRQAARFRIYGYNAAGKVIREIMSDESGVEIAWTVTLANRKAQWFRFDHAWDAPFLKQKRRTHQFFAMILWRIAHRWGLRLNR